MGTPDGFVLAGGLGRRFGEDKAAFVWRGHPLAVRTAVALRPWCGSVRVVRRADQPARAWAWPDGEPLEEVRGLEGARHALWGVVVALRAARADLALIAPCDLWGLTEAHLRPLLEAGEGRAVGDDGEQPLLALLRTSRADALAAAAASGARVRDALADVPPVRVPALALAQANTRDALPG